MWRGVHCNHNRQYLLFLDLRKEKFYVYSSDIPDKRFLFWTYVRLWIFPWGRHCHSSTQLYSTFPGDLSSGSSFVRVAFTRMNSVSGDSENESVSQFFHILGSVDQQRGCCEVEPGKYEVTLYTSCCNVDKGVYYYTTYGNHQITAVDMYKEELDSSILVRYPPVQGEQIYWQNAHWFTLTFFILHKNIL